MTLLVQCICGIQHCAGGLQNTAMRLLLGRGGQGMPQMAAVHPISVPTIVQPCTGGKGT